VVPFAVGGIADTFGRVIAQKLSDAWGQPFVVENKTGAGGNIGADLAAKSPPDGYTLVVGNIGTHAVNPFLMKNMPYDPIRDFVPVAHVLDAEGLLAVHPSLPVKTVPELIAHLKANPGKLSYASGGMGTTSHLAGELFKSMAKVDMVHVPYKGNSPAITDVMGGQAQMIFATMPTVIQQVKAGRLRGVATLGTARAAATPDLPTIGETLQGFDVANWIGMFAPAGTPAEIVNRLNAEIQKIMQTPEVQQRLEAQGAKFIPTTPASFAQFQKAEAEKWGKAIREAGIKPE
ncbi:MAG TPA: tripartite tricarboxylate transporter substrate binding protein, partial [Usitatibacter sp.]|nr:tripartite tricarboxylate transporter substrate binding protein [Usitatibacter sp.]